MLFKTSSIAVEVKKKPVDNEILAPEPDLTLKINDEPVQACSTPTKNRFIWKGHGEVEAQHIFIDPATKKPIPTNEVVEIVDHSETIYMSQKYEQLKHKDENDKPLLRYFVLGADGKITVKEDGSEMEVRPFDPSDTIEVEEKNWVPSTELDNWKISYLYEIFSERDAGKEKLFEEWEKRSKADTIGMTTFVNSRSFAQYYAFVIPFQIEGRWVWLLALTVHKKKYNHAEDVPTGAKVPIREVPTLTTLPPLQAVVIVPAKKKK